MNREEVSSFDRNDEKSVVIIQNQEMSLYPLLIEIKQKILFIKIIRVYAFEQNLVFFGYYLIPHFLARREDICQNTLC